MKEDSPYQGDLPPVLPFDPQWFRSDYRVACWEPRRQVLFDKPLGSGWITSAVVLFILTVLLLRGAARLLRDGLEPTPTLPSPLLLMVLMAVFGLLAGAASLRCLFLAVPRRVRIDWPTATITIGPFWKREIPFSQVDRLEINRVDQSHTPTHPGPRTRVRDYYWCELKAKIRSEEGQSAPPIVLVETEHREGDANGPFIQMLPLATELADALGVKRDIVSSYQDVGHTRFGANSGQSSPRVS